VAYAPFILQFSIWKTATICAINHAVIHNLNIEEEQISWEQDHLKKASAVSFWFPKETLCPITLYELGKQSVLEKPIFVGVHPGYQRRKDIETQTRLAKPDVKIVYSLEVLADQIKTWARSN